MKNEQIVVRVDKSLKLALQQIAEAQALSLAEVCRAALEEYTQLPPKAIPIVGEISDRGIKLYCEVKR